MKNSTYSFTLFLNGADVLDDDNLDALYEAGCDDAVFGERDGAQFAAFDRESDSFGSALSSAMRDMAAAIPSLGISRIEPDDLVSLAAIAKRSGRSRESVRLLASGARGPGGFPPPVAYTDGKTRLWHWPDVALWLTDHDKAQVPVDTEEAELIATLNSVYDLKRHGQRLHRPQSKTLVAEALGENPFIRG